MAPEFLAEAAKRLDGAAIRQLTAAADDLLDVADQSMDLYVSLRAYQSRMFDIKGSFREAYRATKTGGAIGISISNDYAQDIVDVSGVKHEMVIPGLKASGMDRSLSQNAPYKLAQRLRGLFSKFGMSARAYDLAHGEFLVCGRVGISYAAEYFRA